MTERWTRTKEVFTLALEYEPAARHAFLLQICGSDDALRTEVESLLKSHERADGILNTAAAVAWLPLHDVNMIGRLVGDYRVIREAGRGGSSIIYLAERADQQFDKRVAIKMLRFAGESAEILRRFRNERQMLAKLDHPNIVTLLDGGTTEEGIPFLVMDFVEGVPIDHYCDAHLLRISDRLEIFRTVCNSVEYAHRNGVIHRDLKPSNILVTKEGIPQLLDFGIAKLHHPGSFALTTMVTLVGMRAMTPEYASPEQVRGQPVTVATDIYSLGVLLYVLLCGHHPYRTKAGSLLDVERIVCEEEPVRPSIAAMRNEDLQPRECDEPPQLTARSVAAARAQAPAALSRELRGDLDAIAMKALNKEPHRRYLSAGEFSDDISRYLSERPVTARRSRVAYRLGKFIARHRESLAVALVILAAAGAVVAWQLQRSRTVAADRAIANVPPLAVRPSVAVLGFWNLSHRDDTAWLATAFSEMLTTELAAGGRLRLLPGDTIARARIELELPDVANLSADNLKNVRRNLGSDFVISGSYLDLGAAARGQIRLDLHLQDAASGETLTSVSEQGSEQQLFDIVSRAGARLRERLGVSEVPAAESPALQKSMASSTEAAKLYSEGLAKLRGFDALAARDLLSRAAVAEPTFSLTHAALAKAWLALGYNGNARQEAAKAMDTAGKLSRENHLLVEGQYYEASEDWGQSIEAYRTLFNFFPDNPEHGLALANAQIKAGQARDAMATLQKLHRLSRDADLDPRIDLALAYAASLASDNALQASTADSAARKARLTGARLLVADARSMQCRALANVGDVAGSARTCGEAREIYQAAGDWAGAARVLHAMAEVPLDQGDLDHAQSLYEEALAITRRIGDQRGIARELGNLGDVFQEQGQFAKAEQFQRDSLRVSLEVGARANVAGRQGALAEILREQGRLREALALNKESISLAREVGNAELEAIDLSDLGDLSADLGDLGEATRQYNQALKIFHDIGEKGYQTATQVALGRIRVEQGDTAAARAIYEQAIATQKQLGVKGDLAETQLAMGELLCELNEASDAARLIRAAIQEFQIEKKASDETRGQGILARALLLQGKIAAARAAIDAGAPLIDRGRLIDRLEWRLDDARVRSAEGNMSRAERAAQQALAEAQDNGIVGLQLEADLTLAEIRVAGPDPARARVALVRLQETARAKGFGLIARKAAALAVRPIAASASGA